MNTEESIKTIMSTDIITIRPEDTLLKLEEIFNSNPIHHVLVTDSRELKGVVSKNDLMKWMRKAMDGEISHDRSVVTVNEIMTKDPLTVDCDDSIGLAADIFLANKFHSLPVTDAGELAGIITNHDLIRYCFS